MKKENVQTKADFFEWLAGYMVDGDKVECHEEDNETLTYNVYNQVGDKLYSFNEKTGLK